MHKKFFDPIKNLQKVAISEYNTGKIHIIDTMKYNPE